MGRFRGALRGDGTEQRHAAASRRLLGARRGRARAGGATVAPGQSHAQPRRQPRLLLPLRPLLGTADAPFRGHLDGDSGHCRPRQPGPRPQRLAALRGTPVPRSRSGHVLGPLVYAVPLERHGLGMERLPPLPGHGTRLGPAQSLHLRGGRLGPTRSPPTCLPSTNGDPAGSRRWPWPRASSW